MKSYTTSNWNSSATITDGEKFLINGLNIWDFKWESTIEYW
jgi:hypothetical protein